MLIIAVSVLIFALGGFGLFAGASRVGGPSYNAVDFDPYLTATAKSATPVIQALEHYRRARQVYPTQTAELAPYLPPETATPGSTPDGLVLGWHYAPINDAKAFRLSRKLGWDSGLIYRFDGSNGSWVFDPGDGSPEKPVQLQR